MDTASLPVREHMPGTVPFKEAQSMKKLAWIANGIAIALYVPLLVVFTLRCGITSWMMMLPAGVISLLLIFPHELLHGLCFKEEVYLYTNFKQGMAFVLGLEDLSRGRFVFMSLLPNIVFGLLPFAIGMIWPQLTLLAAVGTVCTPMGGGDYYNVFNALTQVPRGAKIYMSGMNSFWYLPGGAQQNTPR